MWLKHYKNYTYAVRYNMIEFVIGDSLQPDPHFSWEIPPSANQLVASNIFQAFYYVDHRREIPYLCCRQRFEIKLYDLIVLVEPLGEHYLNLWPRFLLFLWCTLAFSFMKNILKATYWNTEIWLISYKSPTEQISNRNLAYCQHESDALSLSENQCRNHDQVQNIVELSNNGAGYGILDRYKLTAAAYTRHYIWNTSDQCFSQPFEYNLGNCNPISAYPCFCGITWESFHI